MSGEGGYVAADAVAALAVLGLALGGLTAGLFTLGRGERATATTLAESVSLRAATAELSRLLRDRGPFRSDAADGLAGAADRLDFDCGAGRCAARLEPGRLVVTDGEGTARTVRLPGSPALRFAYVGSSGPADRWPPPALPPPSPPWQVLKAVVVETAAGRRPVFVGRLAVQQTFDCEFDAVIQDCRKAAP